MQACPPDSSKALTEADRFQDFLERMLSRVNGVNERLGSLNQRALGPIPRANAASQPVTAGQERPSQFGVLSTLSNKIAAAVDELEQLAGDVERIV